MCIHRWLCAAGRVFSAGVCIKNGGVAQLGEHLLCKQNVASSILVASTSFVRAILGTAKDPSAAVGMTKGKTLGAAESGNAKHGLMHHVVAEMQPVPQNCFLKVQFPGSSAGRALDC